MRAALYLRMSQDRTGEELGIERDREDGLTLCRQRGWHPVEYVDNDVSAYSGGPRRSYDAMLVDIERGQVDAIVCRDMDRLVRHPMNLERLAVVCEQYDVRVALVRGSDIDLSTPGGRLIARILGAAARHEVEQKAARQRRASRQRAEKGQPNGGGRRAFGYDSTGLHVNELEAPAVVQAYEALLAGRSLLGIAKDLNRAGHRTTIVGQQWTRVINGKATTREVTGEWSTTSVRKMLQNARYAGIRTYEGGEYPATWPALVGEDTYRAAVALLGNPARRDYHGSGGPRWLGAGLYRCGKCNADAMVTFYRAARSSGRSRAYRCPTCYHSRSAAAIDEYVEAIVVERLSRPDVADLLRTEDDTGELDRLRRDAQALRIRREEARVDYFVEGNGSKREWEDTRDRIDERLSATEARMAELGRSNAAGSVLGAPDPVAAWHAITDQIDRRQTVLNALMTVTLLPVLSGRRVRTFDPDTVAIEWC
jgi:site-specific DNA recombinase